MNICLEKDVIILSEVGWHYDEMLSKSHLKEVILCIVQKKII